VVSYLDLAAVGVIALTALGGFRRGLVIGVCSLGGLALGAYVGAKIAPHILRGTASVYPPLVALAGAAIGAGLGQWLAVTAGRSVRNIMRIGLLRAFDDVTGAVLGAATGAVVVWFVASILLYAPGDSNLRQEVQKSRIAGSLTTSFPPSRVIDVLAHIDPFEALAGPAADVGPGDPTLLRDPQVQIAAQSVVRVIGHACGLGIEGSGWIVQPGYVVTNAHVVAGVDHPTVDRHGGRSWRADVAAFDPKQDLAVLRVRGLRGHALSVAAPQRDAAVVVLGYPENRPLTEAAGRLGSTSPTLARDAYGRFPVAREVTPMRVDIRPGNSGGPAVDGDGRVRAVVFARRAGSDGGFGVPVQFVDALVRAAHAGHSLATPCAE
jgi:S1-C subfamily serine protease